MRVAIYTLGCKVNQYETQAMEQELQRRGHTLVDFESPADAYIINTCSVTAVSDKKSRQMIRRAKSRNPQAVVAACGCYVQTHTPEAQELGIDLIGGTGDRMEFLTLLEQAAEDHRSRVAVDEALRRRTFEVLPAGGMAARTRAMLKVEDGCVNFCTYCRWRRRCARRSSCGGRATGRWSLPASRSPLGDRISRTAAASSTCWRRCRRRRERCACGWAVWSPAP